MDRIIEEMKKRILRGIALLVTAVMFFPCDKVPSEPETRDKVLLYYAAGFNNLSSSLEEDIDQLCSGYIPEKTGNNVLLVFQNLVESGYSTAATPTLFRVYKNDAGTTVKETVLTLTPGTLAASVNTLRQVLTYVSTTWKSDSYGLIFSSHATGWLPAEHKEEPDYQGENISPSSIGSEYSPETGTSLSYEMDLDDFADAIPMHLDYILFDACFMGGVEVAYQLRDVCDRVAFSQAEVLADGFDYTTMASCLLESFGSPNLKKVCKSYYEHYNSLSGEEQSATVSMIDCSGLDALAEVCRTIFSAHRAELDQLDPDEIQCFGRYSIHRYFYDLEDIMDHLGLSAQEMADFRNAMYDCIIYKATTGKMINLEIDKFCGLSSYCTNKSVYDDFYRTLAWNQATGMIE